MYFAMKKNHKGSKFNVPKWSVLVVSSLVAIITSMSIFGIKKWSDRSYRAEILVIEIGRQLNRINALELEAVAEKKVDKSNLEEIEKTRNDMKKTIEKVTIIDKNQKKIQKIVDLYKKYKEFQDEQFKLISQGEIEKSIRVDKEEVDPTFEKILKEINCLSKDYKEQKEQADFISYLGILSSLIFATGVLGIVFWRFNASLLIQTQKLNEALSELQQTQSHLIQTEKMASLGQMVAGIAHEINNPATFIYGNINYTRNYTRDLLELVTLYQKYYPESTAEIQAFIEHIELDFLKEDLPKTLLSIQNGSERIRQIVLSLRNFSRLDEAEIKEVDLHAGIDSTLLILSTKFIKEIEIIRNYGDLPAVECLAAQINQVFMNILSNAADALLSEKSIPLKRITIYTEKISSNQVQIKITDNGPGIPPEILNKIFDPFFTTKPVGKGTGLGLSISYKIIEKHSGKITVNSQTGEGTEFTITLPIQHQQDSVQDPAKKMVVKSGVAQ